MNLVSNSFASYELTESEQLQGSVLNPHQRAVLQNRLATIAESKLALLFTPNDPLSYAQAEAYDRGAMDTIKWILDSSDTALSTLNSGGDTIE